MITRAYIRTMAEYNGEMNRRIYGAASRLSDDERGQAHAMLTATGQETGDTDLFLLVPEIVG